MLRFDPVLHMGDVAVRLQAIALAVVIAVALLAWVVQLRAEVASLRLDDAAFVLLGAIPGAVVGGRLFHGLAFLDTYAPAPFTLLDPSHGSLSLAGAVAVGSLTAAYVCRLLEYPVRRWADTAAIPVLLIIGLGKLVMVLGGAGQGAAYPGPLALAFEGPGPWWSEAAATPAFPSQVVEGLWALLGIPVAWLIARGLPRGRRPRPLSVFCVALVWWLLGRAAIAVTWRDEPVLGSLGVEGLMALAVAAAILVVAIASSREDPAADAPAADATPAA